LSDIKFRQTDPSKR